MEPAVLAAPVPDTADLARAMALLGLPDDPLYVMEDHAEARGLVRDAADHLAGVLRSRPQCV